MPSLEQLAQVAQLSPPKSKARRIALTRLIDAIQKSGKLYCKDRYKFPLEIYEEAEQETLLFICRKIENYKPEKAKVMTWVNFILHYRFIDAINRFTKKGREDSLDNPLGGHDGSKSISRMDKVVVSEESCLSSKIKELISEDPDGKFQATAIKGHPIANFRNIALLHLDGLTWKEIAKKVGIGEKNWSTVQSFYWRKCREFAPYLQAYLQN